jgi:hypothetical protein
VTAIKVDMSGLPCSSKPWGQEEQRGPKRGWGNQSQLLVTTHSKGCIKVTGQELDAVSAHDVVASMPTCIPSMLCTCVC